jgi:hypothetical protein
MSKIPALSEPQISSLSPDEERLRRRRSNALGLSLGALALIFFLVTIIKMGAQALQGQL